MMKSIGAFNNSAFNALIRCMFAPRPAKRTENICCFRWRVLNNTSFS